MFVDMYACIVRGASCVHVHVCTCMQSCKGGSCQIFSKGATLHIGGLGAKPPMGCRGKASGPLKLTTFSYFRDFFLQRLSHTFWIFRLHGVHGSTSALAYSGQDSWGLRPLK